MHSVALDIVAFDRKGAQMGGMSIFF